MKKITFIRPVAALALWMFLPACSSNEKPEAGLQAPAVTQTEAPAASAKSEKEDDDDAKSASSMTAREAKAATVQNLIKAYP
ncbi:MAG: hypothetical protein IT261_07905 [Saprospiraceae bacterium]|nr:hypothetical protein [Saprospiraceae bacterium]